MRRLVLLSLVALALAACGRDGARAFLDTRTPPSLGPRFWAPEGWAWGTIEVKGAPEVRYGVAAPAGSPSGDTIIIATGYGESAEVYFETVHDLNARGWTVWVIEPHGQGGSGRFPGPADVGRSAGFDKDAAALRWLVENVIRPNADDEVVLAAHDTGVLTVMLALQAGLERRIDRLVIWSPRTRTDADVPGAHRWTGLGFGFLRAQGGPWRRPAGQITQRATLPLAWQVANPDLRMGGPGNSWIAAMGVASMGRDLSGRKDGMIAVSWRRPTGVPTVMSGPDSRIPGEGSLCWRMEACTFVTAPKDEHLAADPVRRAWLDRLAPPEPVEAPAGDGSEADHAQ